MTLAAGTYIPGDWLYHNTEIQCTAIITTTAGCKLVKPLLLGFEPRIASDKARKDIDDAVAIATGPVIYGGWTGPLVVAATTKNPGAGGLLKGVGMMADSTAGDIVVQDAGKDPAGGCSGAANIFIFEDQVNLDTVGLFLYY